MVYITSFILALIASNNFFMYELKGYLYNQIDMRFIFSYEGVLLLIIYIGVIYIITVGVFKRKKWSTFLAGPFSRIDIRKRELIIIGLSVFIYVGVYLSVVIKNYIQYLFNECVLYDCINKKKKEISNLKNLVELKFNYSLEKSTKITGLILDYIENNSLKIKKKCVE